MSSTSSSSDSHTIAGTSRSLPDLKGVTVVDRFLLEKKLGVGSFGVVYLAKEISTDARYAIKIMPKSNSKGYRYQHQMREIKLHKLVSDHPNIVTVHEVVDDGEYLYMVLDYADGGDVFDSLDKYEGQDELIKTAFLQLLDAVQHAHSMGVYHRDLKPENVLIKDGQCLLADFGLSIDLSRTRDYGCGSPEYMSPESIRRGKRAALPAFSHVQSDIWSLGVVLCNLITGLSMWRLADPYSDRNYRLFAKNPRKLKDHFGLSEEAYQILRKMLAIDPLDRKPLYQIREQVVLLTTFYKSREYIPKPPEPLTLTCTRSVSSAESEGPITPETKPTHPDVEVPEMNNGEDMGDTLGGIFKAKLALDTKLDEMLTTVDGITPVIV